MIAPLIYGKRTALSLFAGQSFVSRYAPVLQEIQEAVHESAYETALVVYSRGTTQG
jgi:hypothetical protein